MRNKNKKKKKRIYKKKKILIYRPKVSKKNKSKKIIKKRKKRIKTKILFKKNKKSLSSKIKGSTGLLLYIIRIQNKFKEKLKLKISFDLFKIDKAIQSFFQKIDNKLYEYRKLKAEENRRLKIEKLESDRKEKEKIKIEKIEQEEKILKEKIKLVKEEKKLDKELSKDIKLFLRKEQALLRKEQSDRQKRFLQELKLQQQIEKFRIREIKELDKLEKISLKEKRDDYAALQERIDKLKDKYRLIRDQKIRERVEALGVKILETDDRESLLRKEREFSIERQKIETSLESFYRSAASLVFQLNKRHITKHMSILRCIDKRFETGEIFIKWDESNDDDWLVLIYIKDNSPDKGIVIEDKSNPEKNYTHEFKSSEIFKASDTMVDSLTQLLSRERQKKQQ
tara:strand:+ start:3674 stop:4864 length:1191 start_codon:yes stop_codon:yes gene_type:complete